MPFSFCIYPAYPCELHMKKGPRLTLLIRDHPNQPIFNHRMIQMIGQRLLPDTAGR